MSRLRAHCSLSEITVLRLVSVTLLLGMLLGSVSSFAQQSQKEGASDPYAPSWLRDEPPKDVPIEVQERVEKIRQAYQNDPEYYGDNPMGLAHYWSSRPWLVHMPNPGGRYHFVPPFSAWSRLAIRSPLKEKLYHTAGFGLVSLGVGFLSAFPVAQTQWIDVPAFGITSFGTFLLYQIYKPLIEDDITVLSAFNIFHKHLKQYSRFEPSNQKIWDDFSEATQKMEPRCREAARSLRMATVAGTLVSLGLGDRVLQGGPGYRRLRRKYVVDPVKKAMGY
jgi:hypothetical protein